MYEREGFRTRQGAILKALLTSPKVQKVTLVTDTGFLGENSTKHHTYARTGSEFVEVSLRRLLPSTFSRLLSDDLEVKSVDLPQGSVTLMKTLSSPMVWAYSGAIGVRISRVLRCPLVFDIVDFRFHDPNLNRLDRVLLKKETLSTARSACLTICNSEVARQVLGSGYGLSPYLVRNGVDPRRFQGQQGQRSSTQVGFIGMISRWIDFDLVESLVRDMPGITFKFHGIIRSRKTIIQRLSQYSNFHWLGPINPAEVPRFLSQCKALIVPYDPRQTENTSGDSMKVFEALASGTKVVSTDFQHGLREKFDGLINVCNSRDTFMSELNKVLVDSDDRVWTSKAQEFASRNSWDARITEVLNLLDDKAQPFV